MSEARNELRRRWALRTAAPMFWISVLFLANTAMAIVLWVDVPRVSESYVRGALASHNDGGGGPYDQGQGAIERSASGLRVVTLAVALLLWPAFVIEFCFYFFTARAKPRFTRMGLMACFCPPLRLSAPNPEMRGRIWLPQFGWTKPTSRVRRRLQKRFSMPMIVIALMILPILLLEFGFAEQVARRTWLRVTLHISTGTIWFAFALEFIVMWSMAPKKLRYCKVHWLDLAIVLLPFLSFLRSLRVLRATRLARLAKLQQISRLGRVYQLRGLAMKGFRGMAVLEVMNRILRVPPERQIELLEREIAEHEVTTRDLRRRVASLKQQLAADEEDAEPDAQNAPADSRGLEARDPESPLTESQAATTAPTAAANARK